MDEGLTLAIRAQALDAIVREMERIVRTGTVRIPPPSRETRRLLQHLSEELNAAWKGGRAIQRRQNLVLLPVVWKEQGTSLTQKAPPTPWQLLLLPTVGHERLVHYVAIQALNALSGDPRVQQHAGAMSNVVDNAVHVSLYPIWTYLRASELSQPNVFEVRDTLVEKLLNTDIDNVRPKDVHLPFPGFYLSLAASDMPPLFLRNALTGFHEISFIGIGEGRAAGDRLLYCTFWGEPRPDGGGTHDDHVYSFSFPLPQMGDSETLTGIMEQADRHERERLDALKIEVVGGVQDHARICGESYDFFETVGMLRRLVINFCLYLSSPNPDIEPTRPQQPAWGSAAPGPEPGPQRSTVRVRRSSRKGKKKDKSAAPLYELWDVGRTVERLRRHSTATDILVRGHFRNQAHGIGRTLRRIIWIEPHIRLRTDTDEPMGHEYRISEDDGQN